jgi:hypothetical protein
VKAIGVVLVAMSGAMTPALAAADDEARLSLQSPTDGVTFFKRIGSSHSTGWGGWTGAGPGYVSISTTHHEELCTAPCEVTLPAGVHALALSVQGRPPVESDPVELPPGQWALEGTYDSYAGMRTAGYITMISSLAVGVGLVVAAVVTHDQIDEPGFVPLVTSGVAIALVGTGVGFLLAAKKDEAAIELVRPVDDPAFVARGVTVSGTL